MDAVAEHGHSHPASRGPRKPPRPGRDAKQDSSRTRPSTAFSWIRLPLRHREQKHDDNAAALSLLVGSERLVEPGLGSRSPRAEQRPALPIRNKRVNRRPPAQPCICLPAGGWRQESRHSIESAARAIGGHSVAYLNELLRAAWLRGILLVMEMEDVARAVPLLKLVSRIIQIFSVDVYPRAWDVVAGPDHRLIAPQLSVHA